MNNARVQARIVIAGRANVGKSTLFNRLCGRSAALVDDQPGLTRDLRVGTARLGGLEFELVDTPGLESGCAGSLERRLFDLAIAALDDADLVLFVIDARAGILPLDLEWAALLRRLSRPVLVLANKCERREHHATPGEAAQFGLGEAAGISAAHGQGLDAIWQAVMALDSGMARDALQGVSMASDATDQGARDEGELIRIAIIGQPNAGKSSLTNRLLGRNVVLTGEEPGLTHDATSHRLDRDGQRFLVFDTAGIRRRARLGKHGAEILSVKDAFKAVRFAHLVVLVVDATLGLHRQDLTLARLVINEGRALVIALNKIDQLDDQAASMATTLRQELNDKLAQIPKARIVQISALSGEGVKRLLAMVVAVFQQWNRRLPTAILNRWLGEALLFHPPPAPHGHRIKIRYVTQVSARPPHFVFFTSSKQELRESYLRYLRGHLREYFDLHAVPLRLTVRKVQKS
ncbi:MAG: ribosome biogenesis GTPase Der [Pseudomonadota bacterium]